jgi:hypothetical protein
MDIKIAYHKVYFSLTHKTSNLPDIIPVHPGDENLSFMVVNEEASNHLSTLSAPAAEKKIELNSILSKLDYPNGWYTSFL